METTQKQLIESIKNRKTIDELKIIINKGVDLNQCYHLLYEGQMIVYYPFTFAIEEKYNIDVIKLLFEGSNIPLTHVMGTLKIFRPTDDIVEYLLYIVNGKSSVLSFREEKWLSSIWNGDFWITEDLSKIKLLESKLNYDWNIKPIKQELSKGVRSSDHSILSHEHNSGSPIKTSKSVKLTKRNIHKYI